jgi:hypothetical protein
VADRLNALSMLGKINYYPKILLAALYLREKKYDEFRKVILELNDNMCILKYELSESKTWIIKIFKEGENKTRTQEFVNDKLQEEYYLTAGFI